MNFFDFYKNIETRLTDSILSLWATGDAETQSYLREVLNNEKLLAEPVFQSLYPWESTSQKFDDLDTLFSREFIDALADTRNGEHCFPKDIKPYKHQIESWESLLREKKSIVVTTGTGSGKTECFMFPVLYDILTNSQNSNAVNAIFLYPLNALIESQKQRMKVWTKAIGGINFAVYNGNTTESHSQTHNEQLPEILSRQRIRSTPPQILFTNPTMLEYILLRNKDHDILSKSQGQLRWILLDEAHTLTGSSATEMALLIRRVLDAFKTDISNVRFAATSATVGDGADASLMSFMSNLCGIPENQIRIIKGKRILPEIPATPGIKEFSLANIKNSASEARHNFSEVHQLITSINRENALSLKKIGDICNISSLDEQLRFVDLLAESSVNNQALFPVRGHFFARSIGGVFVCTNPECDHHSRDYENQIGKLTTIAGKECSLCGYPLLELVACESCGNYMLNGEVVSDREGNEHINLNSSNTWDIFTVEQELSDEEEGDTPGTYRSNFYAAKYRTNQRFYSNDLIGFSIKNDGAIDRQGKTFVYATRDEVPVCPYCGKKIAFPMHFRVSAGFINRAVSDLILEQTPPTSQNNPNALWGGRKYLAFTDSRQGSAKISALLNIDSENNWVRSKVYHSLARKRKSSVVPLSDDDKRRLIELQNFNMDSLPPAIRAPVERERDALSIRSGTNIIPNAAKSRKTWRELFDEILMMHNQELITLEKHVGVENNFLYLSSLFYSQFGRRLPRERSLENLGLVRIVYPDLEDIDYPEIAQQLIKSKEEWKNLVKIAVDYVIRAGYHYALSPEVKRAAGSKLRSYEIYSSETAMVKVSSWPKFREGAPIQSRFVLLICAGLGYHDYETMTHRQVDDVNALLKSIWEILRVKVLHSVSQTGGFKMNLEEKSSFELTESLWLCPVKKRLVDCIFMGYSPWISGNLTPENIRHFKIQADPVIFPYFDCIFENGELENEAIRSWIEKNSHSLKKLGIWSNLQERILEQKPLFIAGEHSAQQSDTVLRKLEARFNEGKLNILSCSTTMEMGVDIGGISAVVMNNVPPGPANYLQRTGRAGRRFETKSLAFTLCAPNSIGAATMQDPISALQRKIAPPSLSFNSPIVITRHINAFFMSHFIADIQHGMNIMDKIEDFFFKEPQPPAQQFLEWMEKSAHEKALINGLKQLTKNTDFASTTFFTLRSMCFEKFQQISDNTFAQKLGFESQLNSFAEIFGENSAAFKSMRFRYKQFLRKYLLSYLADEGFLPSAGIPTGVVEFDTVTFKDLEGASQQNTREISNPQYHITRALTEYAPGSRIVINGWSYISGGIQMKGNWKDTERQIIQSCIHCGFQRIVKVQVGQEITDPCPHCQQHTLKGIIFRDGNQANFTELIEPSGFAVDLFNLPTREINESNFRHYSEPLLIGVHPWSKNTGSLIEIRSSIENAEIIFYNLGEGNGYSVCLHCGKTAYTREKLSGHKRLRGGRDNNNTIICSGNDQPHGIKDRVILGGRFKTDFCELRFSDGTAYCNDETLIRSLGVVFTKTLASFLAIEENELGFGIKEYQGYLSLFIFDNAKGGAGYSVKLPYYLEEIVNIALESLQKCDCKNACTKCLIDRSSQWRIDKLDRHTAITWLKKVKDFAIPPDISSVFPDYKVSRLLGTIKDDIKKLRYRNEVNKFWFFIDNNVSEWGFWDDNFFSALLKKYDKNDIGFVLNEEPVYHDKYQDMITALRLAGSSCIYKNRAILNGVYPICQIQLLDGSNIFYFSKHATTTLNEHWGDSENVYYIRTQNNFLELDRFAIDIPKQSNKGPVIVDVEINTAGEIRAKQLPKEFLSKVKDIPLKEIMGKETFDVICSDRYIKSPFACLLLIQFLSGLRSELKFNVEQLTINSLEFQSDVSPYLLFHNYLNSNDRDKQLAIMAGNNKFQNVLVKSVYKLPHYRFIKLSNAQKEIIIRPDGGVENGWRCQNVKMDGSISGAEDIYIAKKDTFPILYTIIIKAKQKTL